MIEYLSEIPLPGRMLAPPAAQTGTRSPKSTSFGFIAGAENRLVASAVNRLMQPTTGATTPKLLALFGHSGTGKTHLAHGLVNHWNSHHGPDERHLPHRQRLLSRAARRHQTTCHRRIPSSFPRPPAARHRRPPSTPERRLRIARTPLHARRLRRKRRHNHRHVAAGQPTHLQTFQPDLRSRLSAAYRCNSHRPPAPHAYESSAKPPNRSAVHFPNKPPTHLASGVDGTANDLFGAVFRILCHRPMTIKDVPSRFVRQPQLREIIAAVARHFGLPQKQLKSQSRRQSIVTARAVAIYLARELAGTSYEQIGRALGGRDHTTIIHNYRKIERERCQRSSSPRSDRRSNPNHPQSVDKCLLITCRWSVEFRSEDHTRRHGQIRRNQNTLSHQHRTNNPATPNQQVLPSRTFALTTNIQTPSTHRATEFDTACLRITTTTKI